MGIKRRYAAAVVFYLIALIAYVSYQYTQQRSELITRIDKRLVRGARITDQLLPPSLHTPFMNADTLTPAQDLRNRLVLSKFAVNVNVEYVYSFILQNGKVYFTSSSATPEELKTGKDISYYFDEYTDAPPTLFKAFETRQLQFDESADQWGHSRSVFLPHVSPSGRVYITGADIEISDIEDQLHALLMHSVAEALFYIVIIVPFFIAYRFQNRLIQKELAHEVNERTLALGERSAAIERLLDNANQGFLSFGTSLSVENEYSKKCLDIFGEPIEGLPVTSLLYPDDPIKKEFFEQTLQGIFEEDDPIKTEAILSLLQNEFVIHNKAVDVVYKLIDKNRCMLILTDITDRKNLEKNVERERNTLKLIVSTIANTDEFFELVGEYENFLKRRTECIDVNETPMHNLSGLYRTIHTYKGLFTQKDFIMTPLGLHKVESKLSEMIQNPSISNEALQKFIAKIDFEGWLVRDTDMIANTLGKEFLEKHTTISIDDTTYEYLYMKIEQLLEREPEACHELMELLKMVQNLKYKPIGEYFVSYPKYADQLAIRLEKMLYPMEVVSNSELCVGEDFKPFARSLIHVIRNSVDHGIEDADERVFLGKDEAGKIFLSVTEEEDAVEIEIADDGRGIDILKLKQRAVEAGLKKKSEVEQMSENEIYNLVFEDYLSTKDEVNEISGRGVGLASVRAEVEKLGGTCRIVTKTGEGTRFMFTIPKKAFVKGM